MSEESHGPKGAAGVRALAKIEAHEAVCTERMTEIRGTVADFRGALTRVHERIDGMKTQMLVIAISIACGAISLVVKLFFEMATK
ncbi:MAG: hypothetical protein AB7I36_08210 [Rhodospirillaceae bacterium]